jgi:hypothetical protein
VHDLGYHGVALARDQRPPATVPVITSLDQLLPIVDGTP